MPLRNFLPSTLVCLLLSMAVFADAQEVKSDQQTLMQLERDWNRALHSNDVAFIDSILAEEFVATYDDGARGDKKKELALVAAFNQQIDKSALDEFVINIYRDTAVVHFRLRLVGPMQGQQVELMFRFTDVWVYRDGRWQCVSSHSTRVRV